jgi:hypothetical protein
MREIQSVAYRCAECREYFGDPEREQVFETWHMLVLLHAYNEHEMSPDVINLILLPTYSEVLP